MSVQTPKGLYRPKGSKYWWIRLGANGHRIRRSTRTTNLEEAVAIRDLVAERFGARLIETEWREHVEAHLKSANSWLRRTHSRIRRKSELRGWTECMTLPELTQLMLRSNGRCAITGLPFSLRITPNSTRDPYAISLDRIDSTRGYTITNTRLVLLAVNLAMSQWGESDFRAIARALVGRELLSTGYKE